MKIVILMIFWVLSISLNRAGCSQDDSATMVFKNEINGTNDTTGKKMRIIIGSDVFSAILNDNVTASALKAMLPLTISMSELNGNEKFNYLPTTLPVNVSGGGNIQVGDLMLYDNNCLVLFYKSFHTSYSYTRIGRINNTSGLVAALGKGEVTVRFEME